MLQGVKHPYLVNLKYAFQTEDKLYATPNITADFLLHITRDIRLHIHSLMLGGSYMVMDYVRGGELCGPPPLPLVLLRVEGIV